jgi:hypothetical protein
LAAYLLLALSVALYIPSLVLSPFGSYPGWFALLFGWLGIFNVLSSVCWLANPLLMLAWAAIGSRQPRRWCFLAAVTALVFGGSFLLMRTAMAGEGSPGPIGPVRLAYWLWLASMVSACCGALVSTPPPTRPPSRNSA